MPASLAERVEKHGHAVLRDARSTAEEAAEGAEPDHELTPRWSAPRFYLR